MFASLLALDVGPGDEVILPAMTFVACANVVELTGARPVFVDVDTDTLLVDFEAIVRAITDRTRVVMPVQLYGQMCDMATLRNIVKRIRDDIVLIEDCAHSFESSYAGERPGKHSDIAIFSFYATKNITCGEGGAVITNDRSLMGKIRPALSHGVSAFAVDRFAEGIYRHWDVAHLGTKGNLPDLLAALLPVKSSASMSFDMFASSMPNTIAPGSIPGCGLRMSLPSVFPPNISFPFMSPLHAETRSWLRSTRKAWARQ